MRTKKTAIALLVTLFFIIAITVAIGLSLKYANNARDDINKENFLIQTNILLNDVIKIFQTSKEISTLASDSTGAEFRAFLAQASIIPIQSKHFKALISLSSARSKFNINELTDNNATVNKKIFDALNVYFTNHNIRTDLTYMLIDNMSKIKTDMDYKSEIIFKNPKLFRDYITSYKHLKEILSFYKKTLHDNSVDKVDFKNLFSFNKNKKTKIDLNFATRQTWELILGCSKERAQELVQNEGGYTNMEDLNLNDMEKNSLKNFATSFFEPVLNVNIDIIQNKLNARISFEYNLRTQKAENFVYEI
jgi:hypothetical protein